MEREYSSQKPTRQIEMGFLNKKQSQRHAQILEQIMEKNLRKQSGSFHDLHIRQSQSARKMLESSRSKKDMEDRVEPIHMPEGSNILNNLSNSNQPDHQSQKQPNDEQQSRRNQNSEQNEDTAQRKSKFEFSLLSYIFEVGLAYGVTIGIGYLYRLGTFPYYQLILVIAFTLSITPIVFSSFLALCACIIAIVNNYINMAVLTYPSILICYMSALAFNEKFKVKILFIAALAIYIVYGFIILPALYQAFSTDTKIIYYYLFPLFMFIFRTIGKALYWSIGHTALIFLQLPFFLTGLQYGTIMALSTSQIEFWYLMVFFTFEIIIDRTQIMVVVVMKVVDSCRKIEDQADEDSIRRKGILVSHSSGYGSIHFLHMVGLAYIYSYLPLYYYPYTSTTAPIALYVSNNEWYKPIMVWILGAVYEVMCIVLERRRKDKMLVGFRDNGVLYTLVRAIMLSLGFWFFYLGLGIGNYVASLT